MLAAGTSKIPKSPIFAVLDRVLATAESVAATTAVKALAQYSSDFLSIKKQSNTLAAGTSKTAKAAILAVLEIVFAVVESVAAITVVKTLAAVQ